MVKVLATGALSKVVETETAFQTEGSREGRQARSLSEVLCLGAGDGDDDGGGRFAFASFVRVEPPGFLGEAEPRVIGSELFPNVEESMGGGDAVYDELCRGHVQVDRGGARDEVEEGGCPRVESSGLDRIHGNKGDVVEGVALDSLNKSGFKGRVYLVSEGDSGGGKGCAISFDEQSPFAEGRGFLLLRGGRL